MTNRTLETLFKDSLPEEEGFENKNEGVWEYDLKNWFNKEKDWNVEMEIGEKNVVTYIKHDGDEESLISVKKGRRGVEAGESGKGVPYIEVDKEEYEECTWFRDGLEVKPVETHITRINDSGERELVDILYPAD